MALMEAADDYFCRIFELMINKERTHNAYFEHLLTLFKNEIPHFQKDSINQAFTEEVFALLNLKDVSIENIDSFWENNKINLIPILKLNNHITQQPAFILLAYYLKIHPSWTMNNFDTSPSTVKTATQSLDIALD